MLSRNAFLRRIYPLLPVIVGAFGFAPCRAAADDTLPFAASYILSRGGVHIGRVERTLTRANDGTYTYESRSQTTGMMAVFLKDRIIERSQWRFDHDTVQSLSYLYERSGGNKSRRVELSFDWTNRIVTNLVDGSAWKMSIRDGAMDKLSYQLAVMRDLRGGKRELVYEIADGGKLKNYEFAMDGEDSIETPLGRLKTIRVKRMHGDKETAIWCALDYNYLPVQIEQVEDSHGVLRLTIETIQGIKPAISVPGAATSTATREPSPRPETK